MQEPAPGTLDDQVAPTDKIDLPGEDAPLRRLCAVSNEKLTAFLDADPSSPLLRDVQAKSRTSLEVLTRALDSYGLDHLALAYNGGKDCLVLLILYLATLHRHFESAHPANSVHENSTHENSTHADGEKETRDTFPDSIPSVYIKPQNPFPEIDEFVASSSRQYHLSLTTYTIAMKEAFAQYLDEHPHVTAILVGTRKADPHGAYLGHFNETDGGWPPFMRCHPVIDWHYREIWGFLLHFDVPYCRLYDLGYTSLGGVEDTNPNPKLRLMTTSSQVGGEQEAAEGYLPAFELMDDNEERLGRN